MTRKNSGNTRNQLYFAYQLGCLPFVLLQGRNLMIALTSTGGRSGARRYEWAVAEGIEAISSLQALTKDDSGPRADAARQALTARWQELKDRHRRPESSTGYEYQAVLYNEEVLLDYTSVRDASWQPFADAITGFYVSLPKANRDFATLGSAIGELLTWSPSLAPLDLTKIDLTKFEVWKKEVFDRYEADVFMRQEVDVFMPLACHFQTMLGAMTEEYELLFGREVDLSPAKYEKTAWNPAYMIWAQKNPGSTPSYR
jgi:hypothetical protein